MSNSKTNTLKKNSKNNDQETPENSNVDEQKFSQDASMISFNSFLLKAQFLGTYNFIAGSVKNFNLDPDPHWILSGSGSALKFSALSRSDKH